MIWGEYRNGLIRPIDPVPADWTEGQRVSIERQPSDDPAAIEAWITELQNLEPVLDSPGEWEAFQAALDEADTIAKDYVRRQMGLDR